MKTLLVLTLLITGVSLTAIGQDEVTRAAGEACTCLKGLDPNKFSKRDLNFEILGCISRQIDGIAEELKKRSAWADSLAFVYLDKIGREVRNQCPGEFDRLKKEDVEINPAILAIKPEAELIPGFSQAVCKCLDVVHDLDQCLKKVAGANEAELTKRFPEGDALTIMMEIGMEVMFELADRCEAAATNEAIAQLKKFPSIKEGCGKLVVGEFSTKTILGETRSKFSSKKLQEFSEGKLTAEYSLKWTGCQVTMTCTLSESELVKKGEETILEIKRASGEGFIAMISFGKMKVPVVYNKVK